MASSYSSYVIVSKVDSKFVRHYYEVFQRQPELAHRFHNASSTVNRVDRDSTKSASDITINQPINKHKAGVKGLGLVSSPN
ncbi:putative Ras GTPase-activating protein-binding protein [Helianthus anomalus]